MRKKLLEIKILRIWSKKAIHTSLVTIGVFLLIIVSIVIYQTIHLELLSGNKQTSVKELSEHEKIDDFKYLTRFVRDVYPYNDAIVKYMGLEDIQSLESEYINKAKQTKNNSDFFKLVFEYTQRLKQGSGHNDIYFGQYGPQNNSAFHSYVYNIKRSSYFKTDYWGNEASKFKWYAFSDALVVYKNGQYVLGKAYKLNEITLPEGTIIKSIDGVQTDDYVKSLQNKTRLLYDEVLNKNFVSNLFQIDSKSELNEWNVEFQLENGIMYNGKLKKYNQTNNYKESLNPQNYPNVVCRELLDNVGYIKIFSFGAQHISNDNEILQEFMKNSKGKYEKLIIDIRGNTGGELNYWSDNLVQPLLKEPKTYVQISAVKKGFFDWMGIRYYAFRWWISNDSLQKNVQHIVNVEKTEIEELDNKEWDVYKITKRFLPKNSFPFDGKVFILADRETFSAADSFAAAAKDLKLGQLVGTNTGGAGDVFMSPIDICLPNSQIIMRMDVELNFNDKGQPNHICGTIPNVELEPSSYPTYNPVSLELKDLLQDTWINWVIKN